METAYAATPPASTESKSDQQPKINEIVPTKVVSIKDAKISARKGEAPTLKVTPHQKNATDAHTQHKSKSVLESSVDGVKARQESNKATQKSGQ